MAFYGYNGDVGDCNWSPYSVNSYEHDFFPSPSNSSSAYSSYEFEEPKSMNYHYSVYGQTETSTVIHYEQQTPSSYVYESFYPQTNFIINYSTTTLEFNEPEFEEYDDTPYGGGYDIALTYGKPLPPSDQICYPRSKGSKSAIPDGFSYGSIPSPYGGISESKPQQIENGIKPLDDQEHREDTEDRVIVDNPIEDGDRVVVDEDTMSFDEGSDDQVPRYAYGSGLEAIDICDSIFGYWPCLEKRRQRYRPCNAMVYDQNQGDPWKSAADYLFGSGFVYEEEARGMCCGHGYYFDGQHFDYSYER